MSLLILPLLLCLQTPGTDAGDLVARAGEVEFSRADYAEWLVRHHGVTHLSDYVVSELILRAARERGLEPTEAALDAAYDKERQTIIDNFHKGDSARYDAALRARGFEPETYAQRRKLTMSMELAEHALAADQRVVSDEQLRQEFDDRFGSEGGEEGEQVTLEVLFFDMYAHYEPDGNAPDMAALRDEARERGLRAHAVLSAGAPFEEVRPLGDAVPSHFVVDGQLPNYRRLMLGPEVELAVSRLDDPGDTTGLVQVYNGFYLVRLVERATVRFDEIADTLRAEVMQQGPDSADILAVRAWVMAEYQAELLLH